MVFYRTFKHELYYCKGCLAIIVAILWNFQMQRVFVFRNLRAHNKE